MIAFGATVDEVIIGKVSSRPDSSWREAIELADRRFREKVGEPTTLFCRVGHMENVAPFSKLEIVEMKNLPAFAVFVGVHNGRSNENSGAVRRGEDPLGRGSGESTAVN